MVQSEVELVLATHLSHKLTLELIRVMRRRYGGLEGTLLNFYCTLTSCYIDTA
jgi:hypothetical protein